MSIQTIESASGPRQEMAAKAADEAIWLAIYLTQRAGWLDVADRLLEVKQLSSARRLAINEGGQ